MRKCVSNRVKKRNMEIDILIAEYTAYDYKVTLEEKKPYPHL